MASGIYLRLTTEQNVGSHPGVRKRGAILVKISTLEGGNAVKFFKNGFRHLFQINDENDENGIAFLGIHFFVIPYSGHICGDVSGFPRNV